jgi:hypothetical protein
MFGFDIRVNDIIKILQTNEEAVIVRNFIGTTCFLVKTKDGREIVVDRNEIVKER